MQKKLSQFISRRHRSDWQLFGKIATFNEDLGPLMPSLSLTLNVEPVNGYKIKTLNLFSCNPYFELLRYTSSTKYKNGNIP